MSELVTHAPAIQEGLFQTDPPALLGGRCPACGALRFPAADACPQCQNDGMDRVPLGTKGTLYTFTIVRMAPPGYVGETPYAIGVVELPEGLRVAATITADDIESLQIGDDVEFELIPLGQDSDPITSYAYRQVKR
jgi:uncharacterized OB-fold protein